jgi:arginine decarboxylase
MEERLFNERVASLVEHYPPLPNFSRFHAAFLEQDQATREGDMRTAFFLAYDDDMCEYVPLDERLDRAVAAGREVVSACFVTPYPPGFPILVPGQVITSEILDYLEALDVKEIHGYEPDYGLRVFTDEALARAAPREAITELTTAGGIA